MIAGETTKQSSSNLNSSESVISSVQVNSSGNYQNSPFGGDVVNNNSIYDQQEIVSGILQLESADKSSDAKNSSSVITRNINPMTSQVPSIKQTATLSSAAHPSSTMNTTAVDHQHTVPPSINNSKKRKSGGFFSRLSNFRFSLKNSKKERIKNGKNASSSVISSTNTSNTLQPSTSPYYSSTAISPNNQSGAQHPQQNVQNNNNNNNNFIYIPLKDPVDKLDHFTKQKLAIQKQQQQQNHQQQQMFLQAEQQQQQQYQQMPGTRNANTLPMMTNGTQMQQFQDMERIVHKKPPLPKLPPRVVAVSSKSRDSAQSQQRPSPPRQFSPGSAVPNYDRNNGGSNVVELRDSNNNNDRYNTSGVSSTVSSPGSSEFRFVSHNPKRVVMKKQHHQQQHQGDSPIGLIETNLDTHETVITGKTRSLMELHPQNQSGCGRGVVRHSQNGTTGHHPISAPGDQSHHGRPHKSMEFLLDKENQLYTLVSTEYTVFL